MGCDSCGMLLFLKNNHRFWEDAKILDEIMREEKLAAAADTGIIDIEAAGDEGDGVISDFELWILVYLFMYM